LGTVAVLEPQAVQGEGLMVRAYGKFAVGLAKLLPNVIIITFHDMP